MSTGRARRAAGTKTFVDLMLHYEQNRRVARGVPATDPARDLEYLAAGEPLAVVAHRREESGLRRGTLILHIRAAEPITWFPGFPRRAGTGLPMRTPVEVGSVDEVGGHDRWRVKSWQYVVVNAHANGQPWTLAVPVIDLVLAAFKAASL